MWLYTWTNNFWNWHHLFLALRQVSNVCWVLYLQFCGWSRTQHNRIGSWSVNRPFYINLLTERYVTVCGPTEYSSIRLNLSQGINGIGKTIAPLIASHTFFKSGNKDDLTSIQWVLMYAYFWMLIIGLSGTYSICLGTRSAFLFCTNSRDHGRWYAISYSRR